MTLYEKRGRRYFPVHDNRAFDGLGNGCWLVVVDGGCTRVRSLVQPDFVGFEAAAIVAWDAMAVEISRASEARPRVDSAKEMRAYKAYQAIAGPQMLILEYPSAYDIAAAAIDVVRKEYRRKQATKGDG